MVLLNEDDMGKNINLIGSVFGRLTITHLHGTDAKRGKLWGARCSCGANTVVLGYAARSGKVKSCGCLHRERAYVFNRKHGLSGTKTHKIWCGIIARCEIPSATGYANYGGRGITVCERWLDFENFLTDMGECPDGLSIERRNVDGDYTPDNCYWATAGEQSRNTSRTRFVTVNGTRKAARDVAVSNGIPISTFKKRLYIYKWPIERACGHTS